MKKAIQFGAGNIGRGFIGGLLSKAGYHVVFADVNQEIIDKINEDKKYTIFVKDVESSEIVITDISGVNSTKPELIDHHNSRWSKNSSDHRSIYRRRNQSKKRKWF